MSRILVVDDNPGCRKAVTRMLLGAGHEVIACASAAEAELELLAAPFAVLVTDHGMLPGRSGAELAAGALERDPLLWCIVLSGSRPSHAMRHDRMIWLEKPLGPSELLPLVAGMVSIHAKSAFMGPPAPASRRSQPGSRSHRTA